MKMQHFSLFFSLAIFLSAQLAQATRPLMNKSIAIADEIIHNSCHDCYISLNKDRSKLAEIVTEISSWDEDKESPVWQLNKYIADGHVIALKESVLEVLAYSELVIERYGNKISQDQLNNVNDVLNTLVREIESGNLAVDEHDFNRDPILKIREKLYVLNRAKFFDETKMKNDLDVIGKVHVHGNARFNNNVTIDGTLFVANLAITHCMASFCANNLSAVDESVSGTLSVNNAVIESADIGCDLTVGCNISMNDSVSGAIGNVIKNGQPFIHTYPAGSGNTFVGENAGNFTMTTSGNSGFGASALISNTTGDFNTAIGSQALFFNTTGEFNTAVGRNALFFNTGGTFNTAVGRTALQLNTIGDFNTAVGFQALVFNTTGTHNTAVGANAMNQNITGSNSVAMGYGAFSSGDDNVIIGFDAGFNGAQNVGIGSSSLFNCGSDHNVAIGFNSMINSLSANGDNTAVGYQALMNAQGASNIAIGSNAGNGSTLSSSNNNIYIANNGANESGFIRIGTPVTHTRCFIQGISGVTTGLPAVGVLVDANGQLGTISSSQRFKHNIADMADQSADILNLRPVTFAYNSDATETTQYGLIAEEVAQVFPALVVKDAEGIPYTVQYHVLPVLLLNEVQKLSAGMVQQQVIIEQQGADFAHAIANINNRLVALEEQN